MNSEIYQNDYFKGRVNFWDFPEFEKLPVFTLYIIFLILRKWSIWKLHCFSRKKSQKLYLGWISGYFIKIGCQIKNQKFLGIQPMYGNIPEYWMVKLKKLQRQSIMKFQGQKRSNFVIGTAAFYWFSRTMMLSSKPSRLSDDNFGWTL